MKIVLIIISVIAGILLILYATVKTKSTSLNKYAPYKELIGKTLTLNEATYLFKDEASQIQDASYRYTLVDSLHPRWSYYQEAKEISEVNVEEILRFPAGVQFQVKKAVQFTGGVSGTSQPVIFGTIQYQGKEYKVHYYWGVRDIDKAFRNIDQCWQFHKAPWQEKQDTAFYALPTATIW